MAKTKVTIALAGHANVGKSVIFNHLTGLHQHIGNWPGKTIEKAEGTLHYNGYTIDVLDLPGIYSLSTYSIEEVIAREYISSQQPDFIINVIDATNLERNLLFTLQLLELGKPLIVAVNMVNLLKARGLTIDFQELAKLLGVPVVPVVAIYGKGLTELLDRGLELLPQPAPTHYLPYGQEVEERVAKLVTLLGALPLQYAPRFVALKLLEQDPVLEQVIQELQPAVLATAQKFGQELTAMHGHSSALVVADERCHLVARIAQQVTRFQAPQHLSFNEFLDKVTGHKLFGYPIMLLILVGFFAGVFKFGSFVEPLFEKLTGTLQPMVEQVLGSSLGAALVWNGLTSVIGLFGLALPFILPFYFLLFFLEDWGYIARIAYLTDNFMHRLGIHGKACIPLLLGFGCNVNACLACRIMETPRERLLTGFLATFIPCSPVATIVFGLVGVNLGLGWALGLYLIVFGLIIGLGKLAALVAPGEATELIMVMPNYRKPNFKTILLQTYGRFREFVFLASPIIIISGMAIELMSRLGLLGYISSFLQPLTVGWLGLPPTVGVLLILGILKKELILVMLASTLGTANFGAALTPPQMLTLALFSMLYLPCIATIAALRKEFGWMKALGIAIFKIGFAIVVSGLGARLFAMIT